MAEKKATTNRTSTKKIPRPKKPSAGEAALSVPVYDERGKEVRTLALPVELFGARPNDALLYQAVISMEANARTAIAHTKTRGEVRGGGKKPWRQKGTGRARHGSRRSPIWRGGGITFGPRNERVFSKKLNKTMRAAALATALSAKLKEGALIFLDAPVLKEPKTKEAKALFLALSKIKGLEKLATRRNNAAVVALGTPSVVLKKSFRNMGNIEVVESRSLSPVDVVKHHYLVVTDPEVALEALSKRMK